MLKKSFKVQNVCQGVHYDTLVVRLLVLVGVPLTLKLLNTCKKNKLLKDQLNKPIFSYWYTYDIEIQELVKFKKKIEAWYFLASVFQERIIEERGWQMLFLIIYGCW